MCPFPNNFLNHSRLILMGRFILACNLFKKSLAFDKPSLLRDGSPTLSAILKPVLKFQGG